MHIPTIIIFIVIGILFSDEPPMDSFIDAVLLTLLLVLMLFAFFISCEEGKSKANTLAPEEHKKKEELRKWCRRNRC